MLGMMGAASCFKNEATATNINSKVPATGGNEISGRKYEAPSFEVVSLKPLVIQTLLSPLA